MSVATTKRPRQGAEPGITLVVRPGAAHALQSDAVWMSSGRLVSHTIVEADFKRRLTERMAALRSNPTELKAYYVKRGVLTKGGKLTSRYGG